VCRLVVLRCASPAKIFNIPIPIRSHYIHTVHDNKKVGRVDTIVQGYTSTITCRLRLRLSLRFRLGFENAELR
jgi:hypothetical protein